MPEARHSYEFNGFVLDHRNWSLLDPHGDPVPLTPKAFDALVYFLERPGEVISRHELMTALWPEAVVEENNLNQVVATLRRACGAGLIRTVPRRGYQLTGDVRMAQAASVAESQVVDSAAPAIAIINAPRVRRVGSVAGFAVVAIALVSLVLIWSDSRMPSETTERANPTLVVLPFTDTSSDDSLGHIADAVALELTTSLSLIDGLNVPGSTSTFFFKDSPADLATLRNLFGADYILEGDVRGADEQLRVAVRLTDAIGGNQIWSESYDGSIDEFFAFQDAIADRTVRALEISLGIGERGTVMGTTRNADAYFELIEAARIVREGGRFSPAVIREAIPHLERAVALDGHFARAWFDLYWNYRWLVTLANDTGSSAPGAAERAENALQRVEELTPNLPELVLSRITTSPDAYEIARALKRFLDESVRHRYPTSTVLEIESRYLRLVGRIRESTIAAERARVFDPLNETVINLLAEGYTSEGRYGDAHEALEEFARITGSPPGPAGFLVALQSGDDARIAPRMAALQASPNGITSTLAEQFPNRTAVLQTIRDFVDSPDPAMLLWPTLLAPWAAYFGDDELALEMYRHEVPFAAANTVSRPIFAEMRRLPEFKNLVREIGLVSYWIESGSWPDYCRPLEQDDFECF